MIRYPAQRAFNEQVGFKNRKNSDFTQKNAISMISTCQNHAILSKKSRANRFEPERQFKKIDFSAHNHSQKTSKMTTFRRQTKIVERTLPFVENTIKKHEFARRKSRDIRGVELNQEVNKSF